MQYCYISNIFYDICHVIWSNSGVGIRPVLFLLLLMTLVMLCLVQMLNSLQTMQSCLFLIVIKKNLILLLINIYNNYTSG